MYTVIGGGILGWIIAGCAVVVLLILLLCNVTVIFDYNGEIYLRISYLFFTIVKFPAKKKRTRKKDKKAKKAVKAVAEAADESGEPTGKNSGDNPQKSGENRKKSEKKKSDKTLEDLFALARLVLDSLGKPLKKLLKRTRISHFSLNVICGGDDAAKAALNYGRMNILVGSALGWIDSYFILKPVDDLNVTVDFQSEETYADCYCEVRLTLIAALAFVFTLLGRAIGFYRSHGDAKTAVDKFLK